MKFGGKALGDTAIPNVLMNGFPLIQPQGQACTPNYFPNIGSSAL